MSWHLQALLSVSTPVGVAPGICWHTLSESGSQAHGLCASVLGLGSETAQPISLQTQLWVPVASTPEGMASGYQSHTAAGRGSQVQGLCSSSMVYLEPVQ